MTESRKVRVSMQEQIKLINECRRSSLTDADWCRQNDIASSTFYNWISRCRKAGHADQITEPSYGRLEIPQPHQDDVPVNIISDYSPKQHLEKPVQIQDLDNPHTIDVVMQDVMIRIHNDADPVLLSRTLRLLQEVLC